ncbi:MAG: ABC transporter substrate-binding protein [Salinivirgaceae bacterium]|jgi:ABC-type transport system substrate-binding protein|nr:ABC transporter substrate-binding protein [Salinivirgaceae bacterium]
MKYRNSVFLLILLPFFIIFIGCSNSKSKVRGEKYGGTFRINASDVPDILFPGRVLKQSEQLIINQIYVGLVKYNAGNVEIEPSLAKKWRVEREQTLYTFYLNNNAYFHNDDCFGKERTRKIVASDVKYSIEKIALFHAISKHGIASQLKNIIGSESLLDSTVQTDTLDISGIEVVNDTTLVFQLKKPDPLFLHFLANTNSLVFAKEAFNTYGYKSTVGSGAYSFEYPSIKGHTITLVATNVFFGRNQQKLQLPFVDTIKVSFITSAPKELLLFEQEKLDVVIGVSGLYVIDFLDKHINQFQSNPPYFIMKQTINSENKTSYNFLRSNVQDFKINSIGYFDLTKIYFKDPVAQEITIN